MRKVAIFQPYTVPIRALLFNEEASFKEEEYKLSPIQNGPRSNTNDTSSLEDHHESPSCITKTPTMLLKKRGRRCMNLKDCFKCSIEDCETLFEKQEELIEHNQKHQQIYICGYAKCNLSFMKEANMIKHQKAHFPSGKRYECPYPSCGKKFTASYNQKIHYRLHTGERPYKCDKCESDYYDRANYKYHMRTAHLEINTKDTVCSHLKCEHSFKTKKQKLMHHDKLEEECRFEKNLLIRLLISYKDTVNSLIKGPKEALIHQSKEFLQMKKQNESTQRQIMDQEQYEALFLDDNKKK